MNDNNSVQENTEIKQEPVNSTPPVIYALGVLSVLCMLGGFVLTAELWSDVSQLEYWQKDNVFIYIPALQPLAAGITASVILWALSEIIKCLHQIIGEE